MNRRSIFNEKEEAETGAHGGQRDTSTSPPFGGTCAVNIHVDSVSFATSYSEWKRLVVVVVLTQCNDDVFVDNAARACTNYGWQNTKESDSRRPHPTLALNVQVDGVRKSP